jgi:hypothetical protein
VLEQVTKLPLLQFCCASNLITFSRPCVAFLSNKIFLSCCIIYVKLSVIYSFLLFLANKSFFPQFSKFVKPAFEDFILPTKKYADVIIPRGGDNDVAIDLIVQHIRTKLGQHDLRKIHPNLYVIQTTYQVPNVNIHFCFL